MARVKIISNPYMKNIQYLRWVEKNVDVTDDNAQIETEIVSEWQPIEINGPLTSKRLTTAFFPFVLPEILNEIIKAYKAEGEMIDIIFEGAPDEFNDLKDLADAEEYSSVITVTYGERKLENARDILPKVAETFNSMSALIDESISSQPEVKNNLSKFSETASNRVPLVVIGNYSGGKSTFINALIGRDILSSSEQPLTAKIYRILDLKEDGRARIMFQYLGNDVEIDFNETGYTFTKGGDNTDLISRLETEVQDYPEMYAVINKTLLFLADLEANTADTEISDLIQVEVPFARKGILGNSSKEFVIFDTPGSNSKTHSDHSEVLQKALGDMSNGLPIYVSTSETLDTCDNDKLCEEIKAMEQFDDRFTLIIVNKADAINPKSLDMNEIQRDRILRQNIPQKLYSEGMYYVSSVMGLGYKTDANFVDDGYAWIFDRGREDFCNPDSKTYRKLYLSNMMPEQIKEKYVKESEDCEDLLYANSGLFCVEKEIDTFAEKYSPYNKCEQMQLFFENIVDRTTKAISEAVEEQENSRKERMKAMEENKKNLLNQLATEGSKCSSEMLTNYQAKLVQMMDVSRYKKTADELKLIKEAIRDDMNAKYEVEKEKKDVFDAGKGAIFNVPNFFKKQANVADEAEKIKKERQEYEQAVKSAKSETEQRLIDRIKTDYKQCFEERRNLIVLGSHDFWVESSKKFKDLLMSIVTGSNLAQEEKDGLNLYITNYVLTDFEDNADQIFDADMLEKFLIEWKNLRFLNVGELDIKKIVNTFNEQLEKIVFDIYYTVKSKHVEEFSKWVNKFQYDIEENIVNLNPDLREINALIEEETRRIDEMSSRKEKIVGYHNDVIKMLDWRG
ncbi:MAG: dynamin family protein [Saccharofermentans sp.]|nr:dynamin family protein [Saccharofermentans sp.]